MAEAVMINLCLVEVTELLTQLVENLSKTAQSAREVLFQKGNFTTFSEFLQKTSSILKELSKQNPESHDSQALKKALEILDRNLKSANQIIAECRERNRVYLLINCRKIIERVERSTKQIGDALSLISLASLDVSSSINARIVEILDDISRAEYRANVAEEKILEKIEAGIQDRSCGRAYANELMLQIAEALGLPAGRSSLKREYDEFRREIEEAEMRKEEEESSQMEQIIGMLEKGDATTSSEEKEKKYFERRNSLGSQKLRPLQGFICKLTQEVMVDPVETSSGQTFERSAIEKWFGEGNDVCPVTDIRLDLSYLRPNRTLRQSIEEWRERNYIIDIASIKPKLSSEDEEEASQALSRLQGLCEQSERYREWVSIEDYIPVLVSILGKKNREMRKNALATLCILATHTEENKEKITKVEKGFENIVRSLARQHEESKLALRLLLELSRRNEERCLIGNVHGCILLLVTMLSSDDDEVAKDAEELIEALSFLEHNVKQMAKANYFKPLLHLISSGPEDVKIRMAETLAEIELTDHSKLSIVKDGALKPLIQMLSDDDLEKKKVAIKCLVQLSGLPQNGLLMLQQGAIGPLFEILYRHSLQSPTLLEHVAATILHLSKSAESDAEQIRILETNEDVFKFFSLVSLTGPETKGIILETFLVLCQAPSGLNIRIRLRQISAVRVLVQLCEGENLGIRANAVKLFCCLTKDEDETYSGHVSLRFIETLLRIVETSNDSEEISAALGIITHLPQVQQVTQWLLEADALRVICACLVDETRDSSQKRLIVDNAVRAVSRFTVPTNQEVQARVAQAGIIGLLVQRLNSGTVCTKRNVAIALKQLSESSKSLSKPVKKRNRVFFPCCVSSPENGCPVHSGICGVESSFCLVEANAVDPLVRLLGERDHRACEAALDALLTLVDAQKPQCGIRVLDKANAITKIIKLLSSNCVSLQEKCLKGLELIFELDDLKQKYGNYAQMPLVDITQKKASDQKEIKSLAAKILSQLGVLGIQSSFF